jgi:hypothetical protein
MNTKSIVAVLLSASVVLCSAEKTTSLQGKWTGNLMTADSTAYPLTYNFSLAGDSVMGTAKSQLGEFPIETGKLDTAGLHFKVTVNGLDIFHHGTVYTDSIGMDITLNGSTSHCTLHKSNN